jgi:predicted XRE-type DNA-binding protein
MGFPDKKELERVRKKLADVDPTRVLGIDATQSEWLKYELCREFVKHLRETGMTQKALAEELAIEPARLNEIVKYRIDLFTIDRLLDYAERLRPNLKVTVA